MRKTLQNLILSATVATSAAGCSNSYVLSQDNVDKMNEWAVFENTSDIENYYMIRKRLENGELERVKSLVDFYIKNETKELENVYNFINKNPNLKEDTKKEMMNLIEEYLKTTKKKTKDNE